MARLPKGRIGDIAIDVLRKNDCIAIMWGDCRLLDEIAYSARPDIQDVYHHPLTRHQYVLNALGRDSRFEKMYVDLHTNGRTLRPVRYFRVKQPT